MLFDRGPVIFLVTKVGHEGQQVQRTVWHNATQYERKPFKICNLLAADPMAECVVVAAGKFSRHHIDGEPKMYVPLSFILAYQAEQQELQQQKQQQKEKVAPDAKILLIP